MAESTLTQTFYSIRRDIGLFLQYGRSYHEGTITTSGSNVTVAGATNPIPAGISTSWTLRVGGSTYPIASRTSDTVFAVTGTPSISTATDYEIYPWDTQQIGDIGDCLRDGYQNFLVPPVIDPNRGVYQWKWLRPIQSMVVWPDTTFTAVGDPDGGTTLTATAASTDFTTGVTMVDKTITFTTSGNTYTVASVTSATVLVTTTSMSGETSGDTFSIASDSDYNMPDDFGGIDGEMYYDDNSSYRPELEQRNPQQILDRRQAVSVTTGSPRLFAIHPRTFSGATGQRYEIMLWPEPDSSYTLLWRGMANPDILTAINKYGLGGMPHSQTLKESCLAAAELRLNDEMGVHQQAFMRSLQTSISFDRKSLGAESVGKNLVANKGDYGSSHADDALVKYGGVLYTG